MSSQKTVVFAEPVRTAIGAFGGALKDMPAPDLGAAAIKAAVARSGVAPDDVETVVMGNVVQAGVKMNPARQASINAGLPVSTPALTVNRVCGSGAQAIVSASQEILLGNIHVAVAGGMENMDLAPYLVARGRWGYRMGDATARGLCNRQSLCGSRHHPRSRPASGSRHLQGKTVPLRYRAAAGASCPKTIPVAIRHCPRLDRKLSRSPASRRCACRSPQRRGAPASVAPNNTSRDNSSG
jgi:hypothetical protein